MDSQLKDLFNKLDNSDNKYQVANEIIQSVKAKPSDTERKNIILEIKRSGNLVAKAEIRGYLDVINYIFGELLKK